MEKLSRKTYISGLQSNNEQNVSLASNAQHMVHGVAARGGASTAKYFWQFFENVIELKRFGTIIISDISLWYLSATRKEAWIVSHNLILVIKLLQFSRNLTLYWIYNQSTFVINDHILNYASYVENIVIFFF